mgnify:CR=1 FL=1
MRQIDAKIAKYRKALIAQGKSVEMANEEARAARAVLALYRAYRGAREAADTLRSVQTAEIVDLLGEGEIGVSG